MLNPKPLQKYKTLSNNIFAIVENPEAGCCFVLYDRSANVYCKNLIVRIENAVLGKNLFFRKKNL